MCRRANGVAQRRGALAVTSGQIALATAVPQLPSERAAELHLVEVRGEVGVACPLLVVERLELEAPRARSASSSEWTSWAAATMAAGLEVAERLLLVLAYTATRSSPMRCSCRARAPSR
jgi:cytochrome b561